MSNYTKSTNFASKDSLSTGNPAKIVKGTEIDTEFNAISAAIATKADTASPTFTGTPSAPTADAGTDSAQLATTAFVQNALDAVSVTGRVVQTVQSVFSSNYSVNGGWAYTGHNAIITPTSADSKILVMVLGGDNWNRNNTDNNNSATIYRDGTNLASGYSRGFQNQKAMDSGYSHAFDWSNSMGYLDSPASTSALTYKVYIQGYTSYGGASVLILMEIL